MSEVRAAEIEGKEKYRDSLGIVDEHGGRKWVYPKEPKGRFTTGKNIVSALLLIILFGTPFLKLHDHPFMLFNIIERKFILFGMVFGPHDFYLLGLGMIASIVFILLFTVAFGRLFCGWICPQTVFMESVFRKIDYLIEGNEREQRRLDNSDWTGEKILKKGTKYIVYFVMSLLVSNMLLAWIIGIDPLLKIITDPIALHPSGFTAMMIFTSVFHFIFGWFREQACILVCPYGRLQGVLLDSNSIVIAYDNVRGEPRGKLKRSVDQSAKGDCVDCRLCVDVCPTGIDIRNGTQLECVNCTACIDACDAVMEKIKKPRGLIRYASMNMIKHAIPFKFSPRIIGYSSVLVILISVLTVLVVTRKDFDVTILRTPGMFFQEQPDGRVSNLYDVKILNKTFQQSDIRLSIDNIDAEIRMIGSDVHPKPQEVSENKMMIVLKREQITAMNTPLVISLYVGDKVINTVTTSFLGPVAKKAAQ